MDSRDFVRTLTFVYCKFICEFRVIFIVYDGNEFTIPVPKRYMDSSRLKLYIVKFH